MIGQKTNQSARKIPKLPKLTIQQQLDNQQVIERMNRKITFTKNQRYLNSSITYSQALNNKSNITKQSSIFAINPPTLLFTAFEANHIYESEVQLINNSSYIQRIKLAPLSCKQFVIFNNSGDIAPGLHVTINIRFRPTSLHDYQDQLVVLVSDGVVKIPIQAKREKWIVKFPNSIECGHCWVGDVITKYQSIKNEGGEAAFSIVGGQNLQSFKIGNFQVSPTRLILPKSTPCPIKIKFSPNRQGSYSQTLKIRSQQGQEIQIDIVLKGGAYTAHLTLESINGQINKQQKILNNIYINNCQIGITCKSTFKIKNLAIVNVEYFWHIQNSDIQINSLKGQMKPSQIVQFQIKHIPVSRQSKDMKISLFLFNLPQQSVLNNAIKKIINGIQAIECMIFNIHIIHQSSSLKVRPIHQSIKQKLYYNQFKQVQFKINNLSDIKRHYRITKIKDEQSCYSQCLVKQGYVNAKSEAKIPIQFKITQYTNKLLKSYYYVEFENAYPEIFTVQGQLTLPSVKIDTNEIYYQICRTHTNVHKKIMINNQDQIPVEIQFDNSQQFYKLDFYDFYQFESQQHLFPRFQIISQGHNLSKKWMTIPPKSKILVEFILSTMQPQNIQFIVDLKVNHGYITPIKVVAFVVDINMNLSTQEINLRQIYKGNVYNSNKFLKKLLNVENDGYLDAQFELRVPNTDMCKIQISPQKGVVKAQSKVRLDLILQPVKTGQWEYSIHVDYYDKISIHSSSKQNDIWEQNQFKKKLLIKTDVLNIKATIKGMEINYFIKDESRVKKVKVKMTDDGTQSIKLSTVSGKSSSKTGTRPLRQNEKLVYPELQSLQFYNCMINQVRQQQIIIENASGLNAEYEIYAQNYHTLQKEQTGSRKSKRGLISSEQQAFTSEMGKTFIKDRVLDRSQKIHLSNNKGISIMCEPSGGILAKKQSQKIVITMFNDTSGRFMDNLVIAVKDHQIKKFPIDMHIKGTPVTLSKNQLGINFQSQTPFMNLGTFLINNGQFKKTIKIVNNGPKPVQIDWLLYPYNKVDKNKDMLEIKLVDGFPGSGNIVQTKWQAIKPNLDSNSPFIIDPKIKILQGRQQFVFNVNVKEMDNIGEYYNLLIGEPFLIEGDKKIQMDSLGVILKGEFIKPQLILDRQHSNQIHQFHKFAIPPHPQHLNANSHSQHIKLKNLNKSNLSFTVTIHNTDKKYQYFTIVSTSTNSSISTLQMKPITTNSMLKKSIVQKSFILPYQCYCQIGIQFNSNPKNIEQWGNQQQIRKQGILLIQFSNGDKQQINLIGWLHRPAIQILMHNAIMYNSENFQIDFGKVNIKNYKKQTIYLSNPTKSIAKWSITYLKYHQSIKYKFEEALWTQQDKQDQIIKDQKKCFRLSIDADTLLPQSIPVHFIPSTLALPSKDDNYSQTHRPCKVQIVFKPQSIGLYKSKFRINVDEGGYFDIIVKGVGVTDEQLLKK